MRPEGPPVAAAVVCHAHPLHGGMMHFKVVFRAAKALQSAGLAVLRFNFRGVGRSEGAHDHGAGEQEDARAALFEMEDRFPGLPLVLGGFSFGSAIALRVAARDARVRAVFALGFPLRMVDDRLPGASPCPATRDGPRSERSASRVSSSRARETSSARARRCASWWRPLRRRASSSSSPAPTTSSTVSSTPCRAQSPTGPSGGPGTAPARVCRDAVLGLASDVARRHDPVRRRAAPSVRELRGPVVRAADPDGSPGMHRSRPSTRSRWHRAVRRRLTPSRPRCQDGQSLARCRRGRLLPPRPPPAPPHRPPAAGRASRAARRPRGAAARFHHRAEGHRDRVHETDRCGLAPEHGALLPGEGGREERQREVRARGAWRRQRSCAPSSRSAASVRPWTNAIARRPRS